VSEEQGLYLKKRMGQEDMAKTDFEMIFDGNQQSMA
jgi:hypothetical protein